jgi:hypothetical protein
MDITSDQIVAEYLKLKNDLGAVPSSTDFYKRISKHKAELVFGEKPFSKIQRAAVTIRLNSESLDELVTNSSRPTVA